jgi:thiamine transporter ThiT
MKKWKKRIVIVVEVAILAALSIVIGMDNAANVGSSRGPAATVKM